MSTVKLTLAVLATLLSQNEAQDVCSLEPNPGLCLAYIPRYYHNPKTKICEKFIYGGCGGNENNFETLNECVNQCICSKPSIIGPCRAGIPRHYYNSKNNQCEEFLYGGCQGNSNNFVSIQNCQNTCPNCECVNPVEKECSKTLNWCIDPCLVNNGGCADNEKCEANYCGGCYATCENKCKAKADKGPCEALYKRWYFNKNTKKCEIFTYGGCNGNTNNFKTEKECKHECPCECIRKFDGECDRLSVCNVDPCLLATCPENTKCVVDNCGGCQAVCEVIER